MGIYQDRFSRTVVLNWSRKSYSHGVISWDEFKQESKETCYFSEVLVIMSKWSRKNGEEEINLRHLMDKSAEAGELNLWNRERGTTNITLSLHYETRKWGGDNSIDKMKIVGGKSSLRRFQSKQVDMKTKNSEESICLVPYL